MRIIQITDDLEVGGVQRVVVGLSNQLSAKGHRVWTVASAGGRLWGDLDKACVALESPPKPKTLVDILRYVVFLRRTLMQVDPDVVHAHQRGVALLARLAAVGLRPKLVEHVHNTFLPVSARLFSFRGDRLIACGPDIAEMLTNDYGRSPEKVVTIPNSLVGIGSKPTVIPMALGKKPHLMCIARLSEQKNPQRFINLVSELNALIGADAFHATWVGDGPLRADAESAVRELDVSNVEFVGEQHNVAEWLCRADVLILTSRWEGLPLVLIEGLAAARGLIAPDVGSCGQAIHHGKNGILFDADVSDKLLARTIADSLESTTLNKWSLESKRIYNESFASQDMASEVIAAYRAAGAAAASSRKKK